MSVSVYHKSLWPKYKGAIFSQLHQLSKQSGVDISFAHVAETDEMRASLGGVDLSYHKYPFRVLIPGSYESSSMLRRVTALTRDLLKNPAQLVVLPGYDRIENFVMLFLCVVLGRKRVVFCDSTINDNPQVLLKSLAKRFFFFWCNGFIGYGQRSKEYLVSLGANAADVIIPCAAAALPHEYDAAVVLSHYGQHLSGDSAIPRFLFVGRLAQEKGLLDLLDAFNQVRKTMPTACLDLVGEGPMRTALANRISELGLADSVVLHGTLNLRDIVPMYYQSLALVLPSLREPWGLVANESLSFGCPIVVSSHCGCAPELVAEGATGYTFPTGDIQALGAAMLAVRELSADRVATARKCLQLVAAYSPERAASRMLEGFNQFLAA
ncbi:MAG: glycosyltransferase [Steroidobacteraceae bacterium]